MEKRKNDEIGLVGFAGESLTFMPLTTDVATVSNAIRQLQPGMLGDLTAVGDGLMIAVNRVIGGNAVSKSIILLTDGANNAGEIDPLTAAQVAKEKGVKVYTIGVGAEESSAFYGNAAVGGLDEETLKQVAETTNGKYFRATDNATLQRIFDEINALEKSDLEADNFSRWQDNFMPWIGAAIALLLLEIILRFTLLRRIP